jgi:murein L,D-transpeptidase YafK
MKIVLAAVALFIASAASSASPQVTRIVVDKSDRKLYAHVGEAVVATYPVALGLNPVGHKRQEGDRRTPEGDYVLDYRNPKSAFFRSLHISYPNAADRARARSRGVSPGGDIMIHGQPNDPRMRERVRIYPLPDWTDGCIALSDADMKRLWDMVRVPVPIRIIP